MTLSNILVGIAMLVSCSVATASDLTGADEIALRNLDKAYGAAWKKHGTHAQAEALLALFHDDAVIMPGGGEEPRNGRAQLRAFWFPAGSPATAVSTFERSTTAVEGSRDLAAVSGRAEIEFTFEGVAHHQVGNYLILARPDESGRWRITRMTWNNRTLRD